jgi:hypothetical protein
MSDKYTYNTTTSPFVSICAIFTAIIGYHINDGSLFWAIIDLLFWPIAWIKWLICQEVNISIIKEAFSFFLR